MRSQLKIPFGLRDGALVHISDVESGGAHGAVCPECSSSLTARKGQKKRHHFAHRVNVDCQPETVLHRIAKMLLYEQIAAKLRAGHADLPISWQCSRCQSQHNGNLLRKAREIRIEFSLDECRPDLTLFDEYGRPVVVIEIVVTHSPDENVSQYYQNNAIALLEYHIKTEEDVERLRFVESIPMSSGSTCTRKKCPKCKSPMQVVELYVFDSTCWNCHAPMKLALAECDGVIQDPDQFNLETILFARSRGVILEMSRRKKYRARYLANTCGKCRMFYGSDYLKPLWLGGIEVPKEVAGHRCWNCDPII